MTGRDPSDDRMPEASNEQNDPSAAPSENHRSVILRLAVPAFLTLIIEPLFLLADTAMVGHLGTAQLAGLGVASAVLITAVGLFVFLAYATTSVVSRQLGAGRLDHALETGFDGIWLVLILGLLTGTGVYLAAAPLCSAFGASPDALAHAVTYLRISAIGLPMMLTVLAATGILRGLQDTKTPLAVATAGFTTNIALNAILIYGFGWGIAGSAWGTVLAQTGMAIALLVPVLRQVRSLNVRLRPRPTAVLRAAGTGLPLLIRTIALRATLLLSTWVAAGFGDVPLAAYQVSATVWSFLAFALDALAIAAQALTGRSLGAGDTATTGELTALMVRWGIGSGIVLGVLTMLVSPWLPALFTPDPAVRAALAAGLLVVGAAQPISGYAFVLDGVLIGAGDGVWLAWAQCLLLIAYLPLAFSVYFLSDTLMQIGPHAALMALWLAFAGFMLLRSLALGWRARGDAWMTTGA